MPEVDIAALTAPFPPEALEQREGVIYGLCDPRTGLLRYIGQTVNLRRRVKDHCSTKFLRDNRHKDNWIKSLLALNLRPVAVVLEQCDYSGLNEAERFWISAVRVTGATILNTRDGGTGGGYMPGAAPSRKISASHAQKLHDGLRKAWANGEINRAPFSDETKRKMSQSHTGVKRGAAFCRQMSTQATKAWQDHPDKTRGEKCGKSKLTSEQVSLIKSLLADGSMMQTEIARQFGVTKHCIFAIKSGTTWGHINARS